MRDILFRGKTEEGKWVYGFLFTQAEGTEYEEAYILGYLDQRDSIYDIHKCADKVVPETVGQWTGLTDKNGQRIFEGDIVDASEEWWDASGPAGHDSPIIAVTFSKCYCGFEPFCKYDCDCGVYIESEGCVVIGNIHDNHELLEEKEHE